MLNNKPTEIECETNSTSTSATVSINISQSSQCDVTIQSTSGNTTINTSNTLTAGCASITIIVYSIFWLHNSLSRRTVEIYALT